MSLNNMARENPDEIWKEMHLKGKDITLLTNELKLSLKKNGLRLSKLYTIYEYIAKITNGDTSVRILDFGCGGGMMLTYLRILGYHHVVGVDIRPKPSMDEINLLHKKIGFNERAFYSYDGTLLPFNDASFDLIISQQVLEHVHNVEQYFSECNRVLSSKGKALFDFPNRLVPFDTHTQMWLVHYFPHTVRSYFYNKYRNDSALVFDRKLNLQPIWFYRKYLKKIFNTTISLTEDRISKFNYKDSYEGNIKIRLLVHRLMIIPFLGRVLTRTLSMFFNTTLLVSK